MEKFRKEICVSFAGDNVEEILSLLTEQDENLLKSIHKEKKLAQSRITQALMKKAAGKLGFGEIEIGRTEKKAPIASEKRVFLSASHTQNCCVGAAALNPIGIDAEKIQNVRENVLRRFFSQSEQLLVEKSSDRNFMFTKIWTMKEAYGKMLVEGLSAAREIRFYEENGEILCSDKSVEFEIVKKNEIIITTCFQKCNRLDL